MAQVLYCKSNGYMGTEQRAASRIALCCTRSSCAFKSAVMQESSQSSP